jgi:hypothetical protein
MQDSAHWHLEDHKIMKITMFSTKLYHGFFHVFFILESKNIQMYILRNSPSNLLSCRLLSRLPAEEDRSPSSTLHPGEHYHSSCFFGKRWSSLAAVGGEHPKSAICCFTQQTCGRRNISRSSNPRSSTPRWAAIWLVLHFTWLSCWKYFDISTKVVIIN